MPLSRVRRACKSISPIVGHQFREADGLDRFLWVTFQLQELCSQYCDDDIRRAIGNLPKGLTETFNRALDRIITLGKTDIAKDIFLWAVAGRRPLTLEELREAVGIEIGQPSSRPERHVNGIHRLTSWCGNLVEVDEEEKTVHLVHQSVLQFLVHSHSEPRFRQFHIDPDAADHHVGGVCVTYLAFSDFETTVARRPRTPPPITPEGMASTALGYRWGSLPSRAFAAVSTPAPKTQTSSRKPFNLLPSFGRADVATTLEKFRSGYPFLTYASRHWIWHARNFEKSTRTWNFGATLITDEHPLAQVPWSRDSDAQAEDGVLTWACNERHYGALRVLLEWQADQQTKESWAYAVLDEALEKQDVDLFEVCASHGPRNFDWNLLTSMSVFRGAIGYRPLDDDEKNRRLGNFLWDASRHGHQKTVEVLLAAGITPNTVHITSPGEAHSALQISVIHGHVGVVQALISAGVDLEFTCAKGLTALEYAVRDGRHNIAARIRDSRM